MWETMVRITDTSREMRDNLAREFFLEANKRVRRNAKSGLAQAKAATLHFLTNTDTYRSLVSGELAAHFGFIKGESVLRPILNTFVESIHYRFDPFSQNKGSFSFLGILDDYSDVFSLDSAYIKGKNKPGITTQYPLPWLNWLLLQGDAILVKDYHIEIGGLKSRSGEAIMVRGGNWKIPSGFGGTAANNWITRMSPKGTKAITEYDKTLERILEGLLV